MIVSPLPDAEAAVIDWLNSHTAVTAVVGQRVSTRYSPTLPCVTISRTGGVPAVRQVLDAPRIEFAAWSDDEAEAAELAQTVRAALHEMGGNETGAAFVTGVDDDQGIAALPDDSQDPVVFRYVGSVTAYMRPASAGS